ncbi:MAG: hypothetical protein LW629_12240, partial [Burkholderiales bacterium]|nr:hypothetical protein [Burkholderiales bacterium]
MTAPNITNIQLRSSTLATNGWYKAAALITAQVTFSESVFVSGVPKLNLLFGDMVLAGNYSSGSSTSSVKSAVLNFIFTVPAGV